MRKLKNPIEDYIDKETVWQDNKTNLYNRTIDQIFINIINELNSSNIYKLISEYNNDYKYYVVYETIDHNLIRKKNQEIKLAFKRDRYHSELEDKYYNEDENIVIYSQLKNSKKWNVEAIIPFDDIYYGQMQQEFEYVLRRILMEYFPNFYNSERFSRFENLQRQQSQLPQAREVLLNTFLRKKNPNAKKTQKKKSSIFKISSIRKKSSKIRNR